MRITETTFRKMVTDYIHRRLEFKKTMEWHSNFSSENIVLILEEKPMTQESLGYHLIDEETKKRV